MKFEEEWQFYMAITAHVRGQKKVHMSVEVRCELLVITHSD
jgi:hypothetical protein